MKVKWLSLKKIPLRQGKVAYEIQHAILHNKCDPPMEERETPFDYSKSG